jgi:prepilin peptidase CpaA
MRPDALSAAPLIVLLVWAAIEDVCARRIANWLSLSLLIAGVVSAAMGTNTIGLSASLGGAVVGLAIPLVLFALGALGGGDVKLLAAVGAWIGPMRAVEVFAASAVIGLIIVVVQALMQGKLLQLVRNSAVLTVNLVHVGDVGLEHVTATGKQSRAVEKPLPYAVPIVLATIFVIGWMR